MLRYCRKDEIKTRAGWESRRGERLSSAGGRSQLFWVFSFFFFSFSLSFTTTIQVIATFYFIGMFSITSVLTLATSPAKCPFIAAVPKALLENLQEKQLLSFFFFSPVIVIKQGKSAFFSPFFHEKFGFCCLCEAERGVILVGISAPRHCAPSCCQHSPLVSPLPELKCIELQEEPVQQTAHLLIFYYAV